MQKQTAAPDPARAALIPDSEASLRAAEAESAEKDALTASILAGTADPADRALEELEESLEAIRQALKDDRSRDPDRGDNGHN